jgi:dTMP kinase
VKAEAPEGPDAQRRGIFLVLEGIDGSGKSVQAELLADWLEQRGLDVVRTREPTDGSWGQRFRAWADERSEASPEEVLELFLEDRAEHVAQVIRPSLEAGKVIVCDRYSPSTLAYQAAQGVDRATLEARIRACAFPEPDLVVWLRVPVAAALARKKGAQATDRFEKQQFLERVDAEYARLELRGVEGAGEREEVAGRIREHVVPLLEKQGFLRGE